MESKTGYRIQRELTREENFNIVHSNQISVISLLKNNVIKNNQCICIYIYMICSLFRIWILYNLVNKHIHFYKIHVHIFYCIHIN